MRNLLLIVLAAALAWLAWEHFFKPEPKPVEKKIYVAPEERYVETISSIIDSVFSSLDTNIVSPAAGLKQIAAAGEVDAINGVITTQEAEIINHLSLKLTKASMQREQYQAGYRNLLNHQYDSLQGVTGSAQKRALFLSAHLNKWNDFMQKQRADVLNDLELLKATERQRELDALRLQPSQPTPAK